MSEREVEELVKYYLSLSEDEIEYKTLLEEVYKHTVLIPIYWASWALVMLLK
jgi:hypothetical protein